MKPQRNSILVTAEHNLTEVKVQSYVTTQLAQTLQPPEAL